MRISGMCKQDGLLRLRTRGGYDWDLSLRFSQLRKSTNRIDVLEARSLFYTYGRALAGGPIVQSEMQCNTQWTRPYTSLVSCSLLTRLSSVLSPWRNKGIMFPLFTDPRTPYKRYLVLPSTSNLRFLQTNPEIIPDFKISTQSTMPSAN